MNPYSQDLLVDQVIGSAYQVVQYVAANMDVLIELSNALPTLEGYVEGIRALLGAQDWKNSVVVATTTNIILSGLQTIDGHLVSANSRVLVKDQAVPTENGIYVASTGSWTRAADAVTPYVSTNNVVMVDAGLSNASKIFRLATTGNIVVGSSAQSWVEHITSATIHGQDSTGSPVTVATAAKVSYDEAHFSLTATGNEVTVSLREEALTDIGKVISAILTDGTHVLMDSDGDVLYVETLA